MSDINNLQEVLDWLKTCPHKAPPAIKSKLQDHRTVEITGATVDITEGTNGS